MNEILLLKGNPARRRKHRTAAQRAATARMLAANRHKFHRNPAKKRRHHHYRANPVRHHRYRRNPIDMHSMASGVGGLLKQGAVMGAGALTADVLMGYFNQFFGASMPTLATPVNTDGSVNYMYYLTKGGLVYVAARLGKRTRYAGEMAKGAYAVILYNLMRTFIPAGSTLLPLGYFNPGRIVTGGNLGRIMRNPTPMGRIMQLPTGANKGALASQTIRNLQGMRGVTAPPVALRQGNTYAR